MIMIKSMKDLEIMSQKWWKKLHKTERSCLILTEYFIMEKRMPPEAFSMWLKNITPEIVEKDGSAAFDWWEGLKDKKKTESIIKSFCSMEHDGVSYTWDGSIPWEGGVKNGFDFSE